MDTPSVCQLNNRVGAKYKTFPAPSPTDAMSRSGAETDSHQAVPVSLDSNSWYMGALKELEALNRQLAEMKEKANKISGEQFCLHKLHRACFKLFNANFMCC